MSSFSASPNRSGAPEPATTGLSSGVAPTMPHPPDTVTACSWTGAALIIRVESKDFDGAVPPSYLLPPVFRLLSSVC